MDSWIGNAAGGGPEYYGAGDVSGMAASIASGSFSQVIATPLRQW